MAIFSLVDLEQSIARKYKAIRPTWMSVLVAAGLRQKCERLDMREQQSFIEQLDWIQRQFLEGIAI